jgi:hypothetical protein
VQTHKPMTKSSSDDDDFVEEMIYPLFETLLARLPSYQFIHIDSRVAAVFTRQEQNQKDVINY